MSSAAMSAIPAPPSTKSRTWNDLPPAGHLYSYYTSPGPWMNLDVATELNAIMTALSIPFLSITHPARIRPLAVRGLHTSARIGSKAAHKVVHPKVPKLTTQGSALEHSAHPKARPPSSAEAFEASWPYRPSPSTKSAADGLEVRTVFARPLTFSPWRRILAATALAWSGVVWFQIPDKPQLEDWWGRKDVGMFKRIAGSAFNTLFEHIPFIAMAGSLISIYRTSHTLRIITRLEQVREAAAPGGKGKTYLWMTTGRSRIFPGFMRDEPRKVDVEDVMLQGTKYAKGPMIDFFVKPTTTKPRGTDTRSYWLDLRDSPRAERIADKKGEDYVISFNRLQHVLGRVELAEK